jgi:hypothetical protein
MQLELEKEIIGIALKQCFLLAKEQRPGLQLPTHCLITRNQREATLLLTFADCEALQTGLDQIDVFIQPSREFLRINRLVLGAAGERNIDLLLQPDSETVAPDWIPIER